MSRKFIAILTASVASLSINCEAIAASLGPNVDARMSGLRSGEDTPGSEKVEYVEEYRPVQGDNVMGNVMGVWREVPRGDR